MIFLTVYFYFFCKKKIFLIIYCSLLSIHLFLPLSAQTLSLLYTKAIPPFQVVSTDTYRLFACDVQGAVYLYELNGKEATAKFYSDPPAQIHHLEAQFFIQTFAFYRDFQEYAIIDRQLGKAERYTFNPALIGFAKQATLSVDGNIWIFDDTDLSVKKYNPVTEELVLSSPLTLIFPDTFFRVNFLKEYQNELFMCEESKGILVFDLFGNFRKKLTFPNVQKIEFYREYMYFTDKKNLTMHHLYNGQTYTKALPENNTQNIILLQNHLLSISQDSIKVYSFTKDWLEK